MAGEVYLESTPLNEALERWRSFLGGAGLTGPLGSEKIAVADSLGRVTSSAVAAALSSPFYHSSAMDGYAVRFTDTFGASEKTPKHLKTGEQAVYVDTGDPMPEGFNAVIMIEDVNVGSSGGDRFIEIIAPATPWQHVRVIGEDIVETELIVPACHILRPVDLAALLAGGHTDVEVTRKPKVAVIPTGTEIVEPGTRLKRGDIIEFNSRMLGGLVTEWGGEFIRHAIVPDSLSLLKEAIEEAKESADIVIVNAGASAGSEDFTSKAVAELGEVVIHGVGIRPGKPVILGRVGGTPVAGIPGYPVSAYITFNLFVKPLVYRLQGLESPEPDKLTAVLSRQIASALGQEEFVRVKVGKVGDRLIATPVTRGAGVLMSLVRAEGLIRIPAMSEGLGAGSAVEVELIRSKKEIENTIVCIGSHDNTLDLLSNLLKKRHPALSLSSAHVGSMGGLMALKKGEAHFAGTHLLDEATGEYNIPFVKRVLGERKVLLVNLVYREQGLLVLPGNPKGITGFSYLTGRDVTFVNRQPGSGTRLLTDKCLRELGIEPSEINGYEREEYTHMGVASAVLTGVADTGLAILASARALGLDFVPVAKERYDLAIPYDFSKTPMIAALLAILRDDAEFRESVDRMGGYDTSDMGKVLYSS
jgi:putative molybdopterin biosynthesis protein